MKLTSLHPDLRIIVGIVLWTLLAHAVQAAGFQATVSPPRFEFHGKPGEVINETVEISNPDTLPADFELRTADWDLSDDGNVIIHGHELRADSCRPWTRIERRKIRVSPESSRRYRFQVRVPQDAQAGECRVALLVEGKPDDTLMAGNEKIQFPVQGRIAVIIYVAVGDAGPVMNLLELTMAEVNRRRIPVAVFRNDGNAHGRPSGILDGTDASGRKREFTVSPSPVMPGQTRRIPIWPAGQDDQDISTPLQLSGIIEWEGGRQEIDVSVSPDRQSEPAETPPGNGPAH